MHIFGTALAPGQACQELGQVELLYHGFQAFRADNGLNIRQGPIEDVINHDIVGFTDMFDDTSGFLHAVFDGVLVVLGTVLQAFGQGFQGGWQYKDEAGLRIQVTNLCGPLPIDFQNYIQPFGKLAVDPLLRCAIAMPLHLGAFEEITILQHVQKLGFVYEVIVDPIRLIRSFWSGCVRYGDTQTVVVIHDGFYQCGFAGSGWSRDYD